MLSNKTLLSDSSNVYFSNARSAATAYTELHSVIAERQENGDVMGALALTQLAESINPNGALAFDGAMFESMIVPVLNTVNGLTVSKRCIDDVIVGRYPKGTDTQHSKDSAVLDKDSVEAYVLKFGDDDDNGDDTIDRHVVAQDVVYAITASLLESGIDYSEHMDYIKQRSLALVNRMLGKPEVNSVFVVPMLASDQTSGRTKDFALHTLGAVYCPEDEIASRLSYPTKQYQEQRRVAAMAAGKKYNSRTDQFVDDMQDEVEELVEEIEL